LHKFDCLWRHFLWTGVDTAHTKKYYLISWWAIFLHKEHEGLVVLDLDHMNIFLLSKWIWNYYSADNTELWKLLMQVKYKGHHSGNISFFWQDIINYCLLWDWVCVRLLMMVRRYFSSMIFYFLILLSLFSFIIYLLKLNLILR
jgi:hypothetical protein